MRLIWQGSEIFDNGSRLLEKFLGVNAGRHGAINFSTWWAMLATAWWHMLTFGTRHQQLVGERDAGTELLYEDVVANGGTSISGKRVSSD